MSSVWFRTSAPARKWHHLPRNLSVSTYVEVPEFALAGILAFLDVAAGGSLSATFAHFDAHCAVGLGLSLASLPVRLRVVLKAVVVFVAGQVAFVTIVLVVNILLLGLAFEVSGLLAGSSVGGVLNGISSLVNHIEV